MDPLIEIARLSKTFGPIAAVDDVSFDVVRGEVLGFLGPNGAGKTTTMRMVTGYLPPSSGTAAVCGFDVARDPLEVKRRVGYLPEGAPSYGEMTPEGLLEFVAAVRGVDDRRRRVGEALERLSLEHVQHRAIDTLSKGFRRRVGLAQALLHDPEVLILDEPTDGLDPNQKHEVRELLRAMAGDKAIVVSTHILEEVEAICSRAIIIAEGRIVADATPDELEARAPGHNAVALHLAADAADSAAAKLAALPDVADVARVPLTEGVAELVATPVDGREILGAVNAALDGIAVREVGQRRGRLDDLFRQLTTGA